MDDIRSCPRGVPAMTVTLLTDARVRAGLSKAELARRAGTSRETVSAYEHGSKSPNLSTLERLVDAAGFELTLRPRISFVHAGTYRGAPVLVPERLPQLPTEQAIAVIELPRHLEWSGEDRRKDLGVREDRIRAYELILREGRPDDVVRFVDPTLLVDAFDELNLPRSVRAAWAPAVERWRGR
jgi:transcriptional regulator with XRE-family HTH domain